MRTTLTPRERAVAEAYIACAGNAALAYKRVAPHATAKTCKSEAGRLLKRPHVRAYLDARFDAHWQQLRMTSAEVLGRIAQDARADIRDLFDAEGRLLKPQEWSPAIANSVERYELRGDGVLVQLVSKSASRRTILEITGQLKSPLRAEVTALGLAIRGDLDTASRRRRARRPADPSQGSPSAS